MRLQRLLPSERWRLRMKWAALTLAALRELHERAATLHGWLRARPPMSRQAILAVADAVGHLGRWAGEAGGSSRKLLEAHVSWLKLVEAHASEQERNLKNHLTNQDCENLGKRFNIISFAVRIHGDAILARLR